MHKRCEIGPRIISLLGRASDWPVSVVGKVSDWPVSVVGRTLDWPVRLHNVVLTIIHDNLGPKRTKNISDVMISHNSCSASRMNYDRNM